MQAKTQRPKGDLALRGVVLADEMELCSKPRSGAFVLPKNHDQPFADWIRANISGVGLTTWVSAQETTKEPPSSIGNMANVSALDDEQRFGRCTTTRDDPWTQTE